MVPTALYQEVAERLRQRIFAHELPPGSWIDEQRLAEEYGISRTPLREALKVLASEGLVTLKPRRGCYVTEISAQDLQDIFPLLAMLEGRAVAEAMQHARPADIEELETLHTRLERAAQSRKIERFFETNQEFHRKLQELSGNRWMLMVVQDLRKVMKLSRLLSLSHEGRLEQSLEEHRRIMAAVRSGNVEEAESAMRDHLLHCLQVLTTEPGETTRH
ncbi:MAG: GntR family transcriptional regulator [Betaproteobacteria bacterium]